MQSRTCKDREPLLGLIRLALGAKETLPFCLSSKEWTDFLSVLQQQGIIAVVMNGISKFNASDLGITSDILFKWVGKALAVETMLKMKFEHEKEFAQRMWERNIPVVVLKGSAFGRYYPKPETRECGDLDCFMLGKKTEGDLATVAIGGKMKDGGYKHSHLFYKGLTIENHQYLTSFDNTKTGVKAERLLQGLIVEKCSTIGTTCLLTPSPFFNAFFLIKHANRHFVKEGINLRYLVDWYFFLKAEQYNIDWEKMFLMMKDCHIYNFACVMTALCIEELGLNEVVPLLHEAAVKCDKDMCRKVLDDIFERHPPFLQENVSQKILRICRRFRRMWKYRFLADETYLRLVWNTLIYNSVISGKAKL